MNLIVLALAAAAISMTVTRSTLFTAFRNKINWKLFRCPYCLVHWVSVFLASTIIIRFPDFIINTFAIISLSVLPMILIEHLNNKVDKNAGIPIYGPSRVPSKTL